MSSTDRGGAAPGASGGLLARPRLRFLALTAYYLAILAGMLALYGRGDFSTPPFIYQNF